MSRPGSSPVWTSRSASATRPAKRAGRRRSFAVGAAIGMRGGVEIGAAELFAFAASRRSRADPRCRRHRCRARSRKCARRSAPLRAAVGERIFRRLLVARGDGLGGGVDQRDLGREHVAEQAGNAPGDVDARPAEAGRRQHLDAGDAAGGRIPLRPAAHQRQPLRDLLAAGAQRGRAPEIDDQRARPVAMLLQIAAQHFVGGRAAEIEGGRRRHGARIGGEEIAAGRQHIGAAARRRAGRAGGDVAAVERGKQRRVRSAAALSPRIGVGSSAFGAAIDVQAVLDGEILEVAEPGVDAAQRLVGRVGFGRRRLRRRARSSAPSRRSASPAGRGGDGRGRRPAHIRRPAARASAGSRRARRRPAAAADGRA